MEATTNYLLLNNAYIINMDTVNILPYSPSGSSPRQANIIFKENGVTVFSPLSKFTLLTDATLNLTGAILSSVLTTKEKNDLQAKNTGFMVNR